MPKLVSKLLQLIFSALYGVIALATLVFVMPVVVLRERFTLNRARGVGAHKIVALSILTATVVGLSGCTVSVNETRSQVQRSVQTTGELLDRGVEFARGAPPAPYETAGDVNLFEQTIDENDLLLTAQQLAMVAGAAATVEADAALVATIVEQEQRWLDEGELERDILSAIAGEDTSVGLGQVRVSTAEELEQEDPWGIFPEYTSDDEARTERVRRLAAHDWNILYSSAYIALLAERFPSDEPLDLAQRYLGASPSNPREGDQAELYEIFSGIY